MCLNFEIQVNKNNGAIDEWITFHLAVVDIVRIVVDGTAGALHVDVRREHIPGTASQSNLEQSAGQTNTMSITK